MSMNRYLFSTVRVVPNPATGEFANLAAIIGSDDTGEWSIRALQDEKRIRGFCGSDALNAAHDFLTRVGMSIDLDELLLDDADLDVTEIILEGRAPEITESWLRNVAARNRHVVQLSEPAPVLAETVDDALDSIFPHVVIEPETRRRRGLTKWRLLSALQSDFLDAGLEPSDFARGASLVASGPQKYQYPIDYVVSEKMAVQVVQTWSFQVASVTELSRDVKAWGWTMREILEHGGLAHTRARRVAVPHNVDVRVIVAPPREDQAQETFDEALAVFNELHVTVHNHGDEITVAEAAADLLGRRGF